MHWEEFEQTWSKRRRLAREKNEIESVRWGGSFLLRTEGKGADSLSETGA
jgi:hypothetical protein